MSFGSGWPSLKVWGSWTEEAGRVTVVVGSSAEKEVRGCLRGILGERL